MRGEGGGGQLVCNVPPWGRLSGGLEPGQEPGGSRTEGVRVCLRGDGCPLEGSQPAELLGPELRSPGTHRPSESWEQETGGGSLRGLQVRTPLRGGSGRQGRF